MAAGVPVWTGGGQQGGKRGGKEGREGRKQKAAAATAANLAADAANATAAASAAAIATRTRQADYLFTARSRFGVSEEGRTRELVACCGRHLHGALLVVHSSLRMAVEAQAQGSSQLTAMHALQLPSPLRPQLHPSSFGQEGDAAAAAAAGIGNGSGSGVGKREEREEREEREGVSAWLALSLVETQAEKVGETKLLALSPAPETAAHTAAADTGEGSDAADTELADTGEGPDLSEVSGCLGLLAGDETLALALVLGGRASVQL
ncbi:hypothetical protein T492DRAFT_847354 [Pavlovales sp. CCMP2436]|nr:hypothetical protein T492DRAFT_847354 [Pavlovales sp. CCMP2436]